MGFSAAGVAIDEVKALQTNFKWNVTKDEATIYVTSGVWAVGAGAGWLSGQYLNNTSSTIDDAVVVGIVVIPVDGNYTIEVLAAKTNSHGIAHYLLNNVDKGTIDWYAAVLDENVVATTSLGALTKGTYFLKIVMGSKNGSSSGYDHAFQNLTIYKTP